MLGWIGNIFIVVGLWGIWPFMTLPGKKRSTPCRSRSTRNSPQRGAFIASMIGEALWIANALKRLDFALATICVVFFGMAARNYVKWGSSE